MKSNLKQYIFYPAVAISIGFSAFLFYNFGSNLKSKLILLLVALIIQLYQVVSLRDYFFERFKKKKRNALIKYITITIFSLLATISFGLNDINKQIKSNSDKDAEIEAITLQIQQKESILTNYDKNEIIKKQIENLQNSESGTAYWNHINTRNVNALIDKMETGNDNIISNIIQLKKKRAKLVIQSDSNKEVFQLLGEFFFIGESWMRRVFLFFIAISLEVIVFSLGNFKNKIIIRRKKKKKKKVHKKKVKKPIYKVKKELF